MTHWEEAQIYEKAWHNSCINSYQEESKQIEYAKRMGLNYRVSPEGRPEFDFQGKSVIDVGGGPYSILLKAINVKKPTVVDPLDIPQWCKDRYKVAGITFINKMAEEYCEGHYDAGIVYNCLQHVSNAKLIIENMRKMCDLIYIHEWLDTPISEGHIQTITEAQLNEWLEGKGQVGEERWSDSVVTKYYTGIFC